MCKVCVPLEIAGVVCLVVAVVAGEALPVVVDALHVSRQKGNQFPTHSTRLNQIFTK